MYEHKHFFRFTSPRTLESEYIIPYLGITSYLLDLDIFPYLGIYLILILPLYYLLVIPLYFSLISHMYINPYCLSIKS